MMMSLSSFGEENLIAKERASRHKITRYEFSPIVVDEAVDSSLEATKNTAEVLESTQETNKDDSLEKELIEKLLGKIDELSTSLAKLQLQFEKQQQEMEAQITTARNDAYKDGLREGEEKIKEQFQSEIQKEKTALIDSAITLGNAMKNSETHLRELEKELSSIAVDIAKEVVAKEVQSDSSAVALALAKELLGSIANATDVYLRVNPLDFPNLQESLKDYPKLKIEADNAITKGGVIINNGGGIIDGTISNRYKTLKQSVLENLKD